LIQLLKLDILAVRDMVEWGGRLRQS